MRDGIWLLLILGVFLAVRVPLIFRQPGGYDEEFYAVPGLTILQDGIPRLPHVPAQNPESVFFRADKALYSEPPLYFYCQALCYAVLPDVYGTARLCTCMAGIAALLLVYRLSREVGATSTAALWAAGLFSCSRWFFFPATCARPDMLCIVFGLLAIQRILDWQQSRRTRRLIEAGLCLGLGGLCHLFAIVYAVQLGFWVAISSRRWHRLGNPLGMAAVAIVVFSLWLPLIALYPDVFQIQFRNQFAGEPSKPLWMRALLPASSLKFHLLGMAEHIGRPQTVLTVGGLIGGSVLSWRQRNSRLGTICGLGWSSIYLISVLVGPHHPVIGYWAYPASLIFIGVGVTLQEFADLVATRTASALHLTENSVETARRAIIVTVTIVLLISLVPGLGLRTLATHLREWNNINYDAPRFARRMIESLPEDAVYAVDSQFVLDFVVAGRRALYANTYAPYIRIDQFEYDYLIVSRYAMDYRLAEVLGGRLLRTEGIEADRFACYAEIYRSEHSSARRPFSKPAADQLGVH